MNTCFYCEYYDGKRCTNRDSDNWNQRVSQADTCLDYEPDEEGDTKESIVNSRR